MKALNLNQEFPKGWSKGRPMQGIHAVCCPAALALPGSLVVRGSTFAGAGPL